ncbi:MAG: AAA family ATPase [Deltaproteobacteria bacterium]|nr:AAA family ATPase [Deltaproteobacteria bacterium]
MKPVEKKSQNILLLGSDVKVNNLPIKEVSLLPEGSLPAYGYNPGDFIELLAGKVSIENGRLEQCLSWLASYLNSASITPRVRTLTYGEQKEIFQIFRQKGRAGAGKDHGWFMVQQILPPEGRRKEPDVLVIDDSNIETLSSNSGILIIDDGGWPPQIAERIKSLNPESWAIGMGIGIAHWQDWAEEFGKCFFLFCRLSDLETTRMEMDSSVTWETIVAMSLRALHTEEIGLWDEKKQCFRCHIIVEMFPYGILYAGPNGVFFRYQEGHLPQKTAPRQKGSIPCHDTLVTSMMAMDFLEIGCRDFCRNYFYDFSRRVLSNWQLLYDHGYFFSDTLEFPELDFSSVFPGGVPCSYIEYTTDPGFIELPETSSDFAQTLELVASQVWSVEKKKALRSFFPQKLPIVINQSQLMPGPVPIILDILHHLKEEVSWQKGFEEFRLFHIGNLRTTDPAELDPVITLQNVMDSYVSKETFQRPLCIGVFGPPGSGKSFSVKEVARVISSKFDLDPFDFFEFNMTQFDGPEEIISAIEPIRASVARGKVPIVFWDEFDCRYDNNEFGYLRYFLPSMQDGVTFVHGTPYYIGRSIFVFAGGVKSSWADMEELLSQKDAAAVQLVKTLKIPDFMSRLRVVLDIDGIEIDDALLQESASEKQLECLHRILLKRAFIIAHQMDTHWKKAARKTSGLLLRLLLARYKFGARSIEAVIEASSASDRLVYGLPELIAPSAARIHADWRIELEREVDHVRKENKLRAVW